VSSVAASKAPIFLPLFCLKIGTVAWLLTVTFTLRQNNKQIKEALCYTVAASLIIYLLHEP